MKTFQNDEYQEFLKSVSLSACFNEEENIRKIKEYQRTGNIETRNEIVEGNLRLVLYVIKTDFYKNRLPIMDMIQEGCQGLIHSIDTFDLNKSSSFVGYAILKIKSAILDYIGRYEYIIALPKHIRLQVKEIKKAKDSLARTLKREPSSQEIASFLGKDYTPKKVEDLLLVYQKTFLLGLEEADRKVASSPFENPDAFYARKEVMKVYKEALDSLDERSRDILLSRYGVNGKKKTLEELSLKYAISKTRVRQIEEKSFAEVREEVLSNL